MILRCVNLIYAFTALNQGRTKIVCRKLMIGLLIFDKTLQFYIS